MKMLTLLKTALSSLSIIFEIKQLNTSENSTKIIIEILSYLMKLVNFAPEESVICVKILLKYLFGQNFLARRNEYEIFIKKSFYIHDLDSLAEMFDMMKQFSSYKSMDINVDLKSYIKLFEPMVINCLKVQYLKFFCFFLSNGCYILIAALHKIQFSYTI